MRMFVPEIGTRIVLSADWSLRIHEEYRNKAVHDRLKARLPASELDRMRAERDRLMSAVQEEYRKRWTPEANAERLASLEEQAGRAMSIPVTLPAGSELTVDRIYIRKGISAYSSLTFYLTKTTHPNAREAPSFR